MGRHCFQGRASAARQQRNKRQRLPHAPRFYVHGSSRENHKQFSRDPHFAKLRFRHPAILLDISRASARDNLKPDRGEQCIDGTLRTLRNTDVAIS